MQQTDPSTGESKEEKYYCRGDFCNGSEISPETYKNNGGLCDICNARTTQDRSRDRDNLRKGKSSTSDD